MRKSALHLLIVLGLVAVLGASRQSTPPDSIADEKVERPACSPSPFKFKPKPKNHQLYVRSRGTTPKISVPAPQPKVKPRRENPIPSGVSKDLMPAQNLSIRGIGLGMTQWETKALYPGPQVVDRLTDYWGEAYRNENRVRFGATWYRYSGFYASFDRNGVCGAVTGDGLERGGVPILARGDSGADVERLLGKPGSFYLNHYTRGDETYWNYTFSDGSELTIHFSGGLVQQFERRDREFSDSVC